jgi:CHAT domain-containing protein
MLSQSDPLIVFDMAFEQFHRYAESHQMEDLDNSIFHFTKSILLLPLSWLLNGPIIVHALFFLAYALFMRSKVSKQPGDAIHATKYLFYVRDQPHEIPGTPHREVTDLLIRALALQVTLEAGNVMQNIREIAVLSRELLTLDTSDVDARDLILLIYNAVKSAIRPGVPAQPLDELIECLRAARRHRPDLPEGRFALFKSLASRYCITHMNGDYEEAMPLLDEIIAGSPGNSRSESVDGGIATGLATWLALVRSAAYQTPEYLEEAIYRSHTCFSSSSYKEIFPDIVLDPEATAKQRFHYFGSIEGVEDSHLSSLEAVLSQTVPEMKEIDQTIDKMWSLRFEIRNSDDTNVDEVIEKGRSILASSTSANTFIDPFCGILDEAFDHTKNIEYLNESISMRRQAIESPLPLASRVMTSPRLSWSLLSRFRLFPDYRTQDLDEALELFSRCISHPCTSLPHRFRLACLWAFVARQNRHPSISSAYETALVLMQDTVLFSPTLQLQHTTFATHAVNHSLPLDYASYQVNLHQLEEAIETLERGRALLWSEMRYLRASTDQLLEADPDLGHKFAAVNRNLEELTKSIPPSHKLGALVDDAISDNLRAVDPFGRLLLKQRGLLKERAKLISQIQVLPGFDSFLTSPPFDKLRSAASSGPVIIINHSIFRSDILVLLHNMPPSLIPTPNDFFKRAGALKDELLGSRQKYGLDSDDYNEALASVLAELYTLVGQPVIDRLRQLQVPEQSRIWWCSTSVFGSLPLHAMGPIPSDNGDEPRYFLDLYICSYTPTLSALIQSRHHDPCSRSSDRPSVLLVAQPDPSLPTVGGEIQVVQALDTKVTSLISEAATPTTVMDGFHHHQFVHFACHGKLEAGKPFEAGFELYESVRLTLLEIVRSHIPTAEFAFLSACHTAEVTEGSIMDEGLHLAAAVQYCGFRSVVGTMWAMADEDGRDLAKHFYKALFSGSRGMPYHERSAKALRFAVKKLRRKRQIALERWVNFVHYGA